MRNLEELEKLHNEAKNLQVKIYEVWKTKILGSGEQYKALRVLNKHRWRSIRREIKWLEACKTDRWKDDIEKAESNW